MKMAETSTKGKKTQLEKEKLLVMSNFSFSYSFFFFSKDLFCRHVKNQGLFGKGLTEWFCNWKLYYFQILKILENKTFYFMLSGRIWRNSGENIFRSYTGTTSENTDFHVLLA